MNLLCELLCPLHGRQSNPFFLFFFFSLIYFTLYYLRPNSYLFGTSRFSQDSTVLRLCACFLSEICLSVFSVASNNTNNYKRVVVAEGDRSQDQERHVCRSVNLSCELLCPLNHVGIKIKIKQTKNKTKQVGLGNVVAMIVIFRW